MSLQILAPCCPKVLSPQFDQILETSLQAWGWILLCAHEKIMVLSVLCQLDGSFVGVGVALQRHVQQHTLRTTQCTLDGALLHALFVASQWAHVPQSPL